MVEASVAFPVIALVTVLLLRLFTFYLEILDAEVKAHLEALHAQDASNAAVLRIHKQDRTVYLLSNGLIPMEPHKDIHVSTYLLNEDRYVRAKETFHGQE